VHAQEIFSSLFRSAIQSYASAPAIDNEPALRKSGVRIVAAAPPIFTAKRQPPLGARFLIAPKSVV
jgi:hypothetical protein